MDGLNRAIGAGPTVFFDGRTCVVKPRDLYFNGLVEAEIVKRRGDPQEVMVAAVARCKEGEVTDATLAAIANAAFAAARQFKNASYDDHNDFLASPAGEALMFWYCLKDNFDGAWTIDRVLYVLMESMRAALRGSVETFQAWLEWKRGIRAAIDIAGGEDLLGNLTGLRLIRTETTSVQTGDSSSDTSAKSADLTSPPPAG